MTRIANFYANFYSDSECWTPDKTWAVWSKSFWHTHPPSKKSLLQRLGDAHLVQPISMSDAFTKPCHRSFCFCFFFSAGDACFVVCRSLRHTDAWALQRLFPVEPTVGFSSWRPKAFCPGGRNKWCEISFHQLDTHVPTKKVIQKYQIIFFLIFKTRGSLGPFPPPMCGRCSRWKIYIQIVFARLVTFQASATKAKAEKNIILKRRLKHILAYWMGSPLKQTTIFQGQKRTCFSRLSWDGLWKFHPWCCFPTQICACPEVHTRASCPDSTRSDWRHDTHAHSPLVEKQAAPNE